MKQDYSSYMISDEWRDKHADFLKAAHYQCALTPWVKIGKGAKYRCHHLTYAHLGHEKYWWDVLCLSPFAHDRIIHGICSGGKRPHQQKHYPNTAQSLVHSWCRLPAWVKYGAISAVFFGIGYAFAGLLGGVIGVLIVITVLH